MHSDDGMGDDEVGLEFVRAVDGHCEHLPRVLDPRADDSVTCGRFLIHHWPGHDR